MVMPGDNVNLSVELIAPIAMEEGQRFFVLFFNHLPADNAAHDTSRESFNKYWHFPPIPRIIRALDVGAPLRNLPENLPLAAFWQVKETGYR